MINTNTTDNKIAFAAQNQLQFNKINTTVQITVKIDDVTLVLSREKAHELYIHLKQALGINEVIRYPYPPYEPPYYPNHPPIIWSSTSVPTVFKTY